MYKIKFSKVLGGGYQDKIFYLVLILFCVGIIIYSRYSFNLDDIAWWLNIFHNIPIENNIHLDLGRFYPLAFLDLNLLMKISNSPYLFFSFNAIIVFVIGVLFYKLLKLNNIHYKLLIFIICFFNVGFITINIGICYPERVLILFIVIFIICSYYAQYSNKYAIILGIISANIAIYLKEPAFVVIGLFGLFHIIYHFFNRCYSRIFLFYNIALVISAFIFISIYVFYVSPQIVVSYNDNILNQEALDHKEYIIFLAKGLFNFTIENPFLMILLPFVAITKILFFKYFRLNPFLDSLLFGGFLYLLVYLKLQIFTNYYLAPIYFIVSFSLAYYVKRYKIYKYIALFCLLFYTINTLPQSIWTFISLKKDGVAFHLSLDFVDKYTKTANDKVNIYFDGIGRGENYNDHYWVYFIRYLEEVYSADNFDIKTKDENSSNLLLKPLHFVFDKDSKYSIYNSFRVDKPKKGDLIILNNFTNKYINKEYIENMNKDYSLIYKTNLLGLPQINLKTMIKYLLKDSNIQYTQNSNVFKLPIDTYIYIVK